MLGAGSSTCTPSTNPHSRPAPCMGAHAQQNTWQPCTGQAPGQLLGQAPGHPQAAAATAPTGMLAAGSSACTPSTNPHSRPAPCVGAQAQQNTWQPCAGQAPGQLLGQAPGHPQAAAVTAPTGMLGAGSSACTPSTNPHSRPAPCMGAHAQQNTGQPCAGQPPQAAAPAAPGTRLEAPKSRQHSGVQVKLELCPKPYTALLFVAKSPRWPPQLLQEVCSWDTARDRGEGEVAFSVSAYKSVLQRFEALAAAGLDFSPLPSWVCTVAGFERGGPPCGGLPLAEAKAKVDQFLGSLPEGGQASSVLPYQKEGLAFGLHRAGRVLLGDEMGLGKTLQALLLAAYFEAEWPILVIAPSSLRFVWRDQAAQWLPHLVGEDGNLVHVVRNSKDKVSKSARVVVATYDLLRRCEALRRRTDGRDYLAVIVDESQSIKERQDESTSQRTKVVVGICKAARRVLLLSGTPAVNRAAELYTQLEALLPSGMPSFAQFAERYSYKQPMPWLWPLVVWSGGPRHVTQLRVARFGGRSTVKWNGAQRTPELNSRGLLGTVMIRRLKKDVLQQRGDQGAWLPPKRRVKVPLDPEKMNQETLKEAERQSRQMGPSDFVASKGLGDCAQLFRLTAEAKLGAVLEYVEHLLSTGAKFLLFGHHHLVLDAVQAKLQRMHCGHIRIDGHTSAVARPALVSQFQEDESVRVAVLSITAAGTGLTLTAAQTIVFAELYWVPGLMQQAEDRAHRIGQRDSVTVHYLIAKKTLDEVLFQTLEKKTFSTTGILNGLSSGLDVTCQGTQKRERESEEEPPTKRQRESSP
ncbi:unnamed protein product [Effrenium voratum]|nr:unnamed protein product [Effrenium voratum]